MIRYTEYDPICVPNADGDFIFIDPAAIIYVEANGKYSHIYCVNNKTYKSVSMTLMNIHSRLPEKLFYRVHNSYLVSRSYMIGMNRKKTRIFCVDNIVINIGRCYLPDFLQRFGMSKKDKPGD